MFSRCLITLLVHGCGTASRGSAVVRKIQLFMYFYSTSKTLFKHVITENGELEGVCHVVVLWVMPVSSPVFTGFAVKPGCIEIKACVLHSGSSCIIVIMQPVVSPPPASLHKSCWHSFRPQSP